MSSKYTNYGPRAYDFIIRATGLCKFHVGDSVTVVLPSHQNQSSKLVRTYSILNKYSKPIPNLEPQTR